MHAYTGSAEPQRRWSGFCLTASPPEPPYDDKDPQYNQQEAHEPAPVPALPLRHLVHTSECTSQKRRRRSEGVVLQVSFELTDVQASMCLGYGPGALDAM